MWQLIVLSFCCFVGIHYGNGWDLFWSATLEFFSFKSSTIQNVSLLTCLKILPVGIMLGLVVCIVVSNFMKIIGVYGNNLAVVKQSTLNDLKNTSLLNFVFFIFFFEEGIFRLLPIAIASLTNSNVVMLLIIFNIFFAIVHIGNFHTSNILVTIPQFCVGLILSIIAFKFGVFTAGIVHLYYDFVLFATERRIEYKITNFFITLYYGLIAYIGYILSFDDFVKLFSILSWSNPIPKNYPLDFQSALGIVLLTTGVVKFVGNLAGLDNSISTLSDNVKFNNFGKTLAYASAICIIIGLLVVWLLTNTYLPFYYYPLLTSTLFALIFIGLSSNKSLSQSAFNSFKIPVSALSYIIYSILGPFITVQLIVIELIIQLPELLLLNNKEVI